jgi:hypothetical protein
MELSGPAFAIASGLIVIFISSETALHIPTGSFVVRVSVTIPEAISFDEGVYLAEDNEASSNVPLPDVVHVKEDAPPPTLPAKVYDVPEQITASAEAFAIAAGSIVNTIAFHVSEHGPAGSFVVKVRITLPAVKSADEGVYVAVGDVLSSKEPVPLLVQVSEDAPPPTVPDNLYELPSQIVASGPASAVAIGLIVKETLSTTAGQPFAASTVY